MHISLCIMAASDDAHVGCAHTADGGRLAATDHQSVLLDACSVPMRLDLRVLLATDWTGCRSQACVRTAASVLTCAHHNIRSRGACMKNAVIHFIQINTGVAAAPMRDDQRFWSLLPPSRGRATMVGYNALIDSSTRHVPSVTVHPCSAAVRAAAEQMEMAWRRCGDNMETMIQMIHVAATRGD